MYAEMRAHMLDHLNTSPELLGWTHRGSDDPGIALLEGAAVVGDILTYYQSLYANETFLRTAKWRESVAELVQLLGYRLAPGIGGEAHFALAVKGERPVTVPKGFGFKAQLEGRDEPAEFESTAENLAYPHLGQFNLYRPRLALQNITAGPANNKLEIHAVDGRTDVASLASVELKPGDRIMLVPDSAMFDVPGTPYSSQKKAEIVIVSEVETVLDRTTITFEGSLTETRGTTVRAYVIGRTFAHFGHNAPAVLTRHDDDPPTTTQEPTTFVRRIYGTHSPSSSDADYYPSILATDMPLEQEVDDLAAGGNLICQGFMDFTSAPNPPVPFTVVKRVEAVRPDALTWGNQSGSTTVVTLNSRLAANPVILFEEADIRQLRFHEVVSPELALRAPTSWASGDFTDGAVGFFGTHTEAKALEGRNLLLAKEGRSPQLVRVGSPLPDLSLSGRDTVNPWMWPITLNDVPAFAREDFDEADPAVTVYGNVVAATQGKTEDEVVIGSGDQRQAFQTFALPKTPLTYLLDETRTPAETPELKIYVGGILWQRVDTFFNSGPDDQVYVVREDNDGASWVQFGDGIMGARLPSGRNNVVAVYRTGNGAASSLEPDAKPQATGKLKEVDKAFMPGPAVGGGPPESEDGARVAAPGRMQSLGRLVSLADFESEALAIPGVVKAGAVWTPSGGVPVVRLTVLTEQGSDAAVAKVRETMETYNRCRGPARFPIIVVEGIRQYVYLDLRVDYEASRREPDIEAAVRQSLGLGGEEAEDAEAGPGLFALAAREFGQDAHVSQIIGAVQNVPSVTWVEVDAAQPIDQGDPAVTDPMELDKPLPARRDEVVACDTDRTLSLHERHLDLSLAIDQRAEGCEP